jgi:beta-N-acetylhexosaminidase
VILCAAIVAAAGLACMLTDGGGESSRQAPSETRTTTASSTPTPRAEELAQARLEEMSLGQMIGQVMMVGVEGSALTEEGCAALREVTPGGIFYQAGGNVETPEQLRSFGGQIWECLEGVAPAAPFLAIDHEGQFIYRFLEGGVTEFPTALALAAGGDAQLAGRIAQAAGEELAYSGVNMIFGPVADVLSSADSRILGVRTYGGSAEQVSRFVGAAVGGYRQAGLIPVLKHFPGHGGVSEDSHEALPSDPVDLETWRAGYLAPFQAGLRAGAEAVMSGHIAFPTISGDNRPATLSAELLGLARAEMANGVIISDAMDMKAASQAVGGVEQAAVEALKAGIDVVLINRPGQVKAVYDRLVEAVQSGELPRERLEQAAGRILRLKARSGILEQPFVLAGQPDLEAHSELDYEAGRRAITVYRDREGLIPLAEGVERVLIAGPTPEWFFYQELSERLREEGIEATLVSYALESENRSAEEAALAKTLPERLAAAELEGKGYDLMIVFTWQSYHNRVLFGDGYQVDVVNSLLGSGAPAIVIALRSPTDLLDYSQASTSVATFGHTRGTLKGLVEILLGEREAVGSNPLRWLSIP